MIRNDITFVRRPRQTITKLHSWCGWDWKLPDRQIAKAFWWREIFISITGWALKPLPITESMPPPAFR